MSLIQADNGDGTVTFSDPEAGKEWPPIAKTEIARRKAAAEARRAARAPPVPGVAFLKRLTDDEYQAIDAAATANIQIKRWRDELFANGEVRVAGDEAQAAKAALVAANLLTPQRAELVFAPQG